MVVFNLFVCLFKFLFVCLFCLFSAHLFKWHSELMCSFKHAPSNYCKAELVVNKQTKI